MPCEPAPGQRRVWPAGDLRRYLVEGPAQQALAAPREVNARRHAGRELRQLAVQVGRAQLERYQHSRAIGLRQDVVLQPGTLVERHEDRGQRGPGPVADRLAHGCVGELPGMGVETQGERVVVAAGLLPALVGQRHGVRHRGVGQRVGRGDRHRARHVRHAVVGDAVDLVGRVAVRGRPRGLEAAALVDRDVDEHRAALHRRQLLAPLGVVPFFIGLAGPAYAAVSTLGGAVFLLLAWRVFRSRAGDTPEAFGARGEGLYNPQAEAKHARTKEIQLSLASAEDNPIQRLVS